jgi:hypothetical protein
MTLINPNGQLILSTISNHRISGRQEHIWLAWGHSCCAIVDCDRETFAFSD